MAEIKYIKINSADDANDLFNEMCKEILNMTPDQAKKELLKMEGSKKEISNYKATMFDVLNIIVAYDIPFELKVNYLENSERKTETTPTKMHQNADATQKVLSDQKNEITNPELKESAISGMESKAALGENNPPGHHIGKFPGAPDFLAEGN
jgi:hypothetical protein